MVMLINPNYAHGSDTYIKNLFASMNYNWERNIYVK